MAYNPYTQYYLEQAGGGVNSVYSGVAYQRGHGSIGSFLGGLWRSIMPLFKKGAKAVGSELLKSTGNFAADVALKRQPWKQSLKSRIGESADNLNDKLKNKLNTMIGSGYKKRKKRKRSQSVVRRGSVRKGKTRKKVKSKRRKTVKRKINLPRDIFS